MVAKTKTQHDCRAVANAIITHFKSRSLAPLTPTKLEKLVFLCDVFHEECFGYPLCKQMRRDGRIYPYYDELKDALRKVPNEKEPELIFEEHTSFFGLKVEKRYFTSEFSNAQKKLFELVFVLLERYQLTEAQLTFLIGCDDEIQPLDIKPNKHTPIGAKGLISKLEEHAANNWKEPAERISNG